MSDSFFPARALPRIAVVGASAALLVGPLPATAQSRQADIGVEQTFVVRIENVSKRALNLSNGGTSEIPMSSGVWVIHAGNNPIFTPGEADPGRGLKGLAEAGMAGAFAPNLRSLQNVRSAGAFERPLGRPRRMMATSSPAPGDGANASRMLRFGQHFEFSVTAKSGDRLSLAMMIAQSNDGLIATGREGIALFDASGRPVSGDVTAQLSMWDAGTEVNEDPGLGRNQGLRQGAPHAGDPERRPVRLMSEAEFGDRWPPVSQIVRVTITPRKPR